MNTYPDPAAEAAAPEEADALLNALGQDDAPLMWQKLLRGGGR